MLTGFPFWLQFISHYARTDERKDFVRAEFIAGRERHLCDAVIKKPNPEFGAPISK
jgi:hypothetical protein